MNIDPQLTPFLAGATAFPKAGSIPVTELRALVRQASTAFPPPALPIGAVEDRTIGGPGCDLRVRVYTPAGEGPFPVIVYFHGGGWIVGDLDTQDMICRGLCHGAGSVVVSVDYRLAPEHPYPAASDDCWAATAWAAANAAAIGGIPGCVAVAGDSAGATLAAGVALRARDADGGPALCGQVLFYGSCNYPSDETPSMREFREAPFLRSEEVAYFWNTYLAAPETQQHDPLVSPIRAPSHVGLAPAFIATAETDPIRDDGEAYAHALVAAGVPVLTRRYLGMVHGFVSWLAILDGARLAIDDASVWLRMQFARCQGR